jgi:predicted RNase H-like nuclease (RuvC/YqgF family)
VELNKPSYEELSEEASSLRTTVCEQAALIEKLTAEIAELRARLNMNSRNSSKPVCHER